ncbi:hypothetical protein CCP4SC76_8080005 [Gammaproteobacteria bacterium]
MRDVLNQSDAASTQNTPAAFIAALIAWVTASRQPRLPGSVDELEQFGLDGNIANNLRNLVSQGQSEARVVAAFIHVLTQLPVGECFDRSARRAILKAWKQVVPDQALDQTMREALATTTQDAWYWH